MRSAGGRLFEVRSDQVMQAASVAPESPGPKTPAKADLERRRAALHRRSAALRAPTSLADEAAFIKEFDAIEREAADIDAAMAWLANARRLAALRTVPGAVSSRWRLAGRFTGPGGDARCYQTSLSCMTYSNI
jgi:hypothetical protein